MKLNLNSVEGYVANHLKLFIYTAFALLVFVGIIAVSIFFISVRGAEQTMVPDVQGKELTDALLELQVKELYPRIQLRFSQSSQDKGLIIEQDPRAGAIVKAGRRVRLVVSRGVMLNHVENYVGRNIDEVRMSLQTLIADSGSLPLLTVKEPILYDYSAEAPGTILRQKPEAETGISGPMALEFVVSRGPQNTLLTVPQFAGLPLDAALEQIGKTGIYVAFSLRFPVDGEQSETVVDQSPPAGATIPVKNIVNLTVSAPVDLADGEVFKLFRYTVPENPYPLALRLDAILPSGDRVRLIGVEYSGGEFTVPYRLPVGATLILSMLNREIYREVVTG